MTLEEMLKSMVENCKIVSFSISTYYLFIESNCMFFEDEVSMINNLLLANDYSLISAHGFIDYCRSGNVSVTRYIFRKSFL